MKHLKDGHLFECLNEELSDQDDRAAQEHLSSCSECDGMMTDLRSFKDFVGIEASMDSRRFVSGVMARIDAEESEGKVGFWEDVRRFFAPAVLAAASVCFVFFNINSSDPAVDHNSAEFDAEFGLVAGDVETNMMFFGADEVGEGMVL